MIAIGRHLLLIISLTGMHRNVITHAGLTLSVNLEDTDNIDYTDIGFSVEGELFFNDAQKTRNVNWELCH